MKRGKFPHGMIPPRRIRGALHRRLFFWFTGSIILTAFITVAVTRLGGSDGSWKRETERVYSFVSNRFAEKWEDRGAVDHLAKAFADDLSLEITVQDLSGTTLARAGSSCDSSKHLVPIMRDGRQIGSVSVGICRPRSLWHGPLPLFAAVLTLWAASGWFASRITRPLRLVTRAASEIGRGKLSTRVQLSVHQVGEVRILADVINDMASRIERQLADQRALLATVSHEIRTPLARMRFLAEQARSQGCSKETADSLDREILEVDTLVGDLLASSRLYFAAFSTTLLEPADLARRAVEQCDLDPSILDVEENLASLKGDPTLLVRALANLLENSRKHAGSIEHFRVYSGAGRICFVVEDRGPGFEPGEGEKVFQAFYKRDRNDSSAGVGLGLSLVKRIAEAHGGVAYATNREEDGGGARVGIKIPFFGPSEDDSD